MSDTSIQEASASEETAKRDEVPQAVLDMQQALSDLNAYSNLVKDGTFDGRSSETVVKLIGFLKQLYSQVYAAYTNDPYVKSKTQPKDGV